jgi:hypothetical protein
MTTAPPDIPEGLLEQVVSALGGCDGGDGAPLAAPFAKHLSDCLSLAWLEVGDDRLGVTKFEGGHNEMFRLRRLGLPPGEIEILLNPVLVEDKALFRHTLAHEILHAAGLLEHDDAHERMVDLIAPSPSIEDSPLLQKLRSQVLDEMSRKEWLCQNCGFTYARETVRKPLRCPKCARKL